MHSIMRINQIFSFENFLEMYIKVQVLEKRIEEMQER